MLGRLFPSSPPPLRPIDDPHSRHLMHSCRQQAESTTERLKWREINGGRGEGTRTLTAETSMEILDKYDKPVSLRYDAKSFSCFRLPRDSPRDAPLGLPHPPEQSFREWIVSWCHFVCFSSESAFPPSTVPAKSPSFLYILTHLLYACTLYARIHTYICTRFICMYVYALRIYLYIEKICLVTQSRASRDYSRVKSHGRRKKSEHDTAR